LGLILSIYLISSTKKAATFRLLAANQTKSFCWLWVRSYWLMMLSPPVKGLKRRLIMATAAKVITAALQRILVQGSESDLQPDEYQDAIFAMNNFMLALDADGVSLGYTEVTNLGDEVTIPAGALRGLIANLAIEVSPDYNGTITQGLVAAATAGLAVMQKLGVSTPITHLPCTLPIGSGNANHYNSNFYDCAEDDILAETTGSIALESGTNQAAGV